VSKISALLPKLSKLSPEGRASLAAELRANIARREPQRKLYSYYPDTGPLRRELYPRHLEFFAAGGIHEPFASCPEGCDGSPHRERLFLAANRVGKTEGVGGYECATHTTGRYPPWWRGHRFEYPVDWWAAGKTNETTRDIIQAKLFGKITMVGTRKRLSGTGLIPGEDIADVQFKRGADLIDVAQIKNQFGGFSTIGLKSYEQGRGVFEGTEKHGVWFDEEPPLLLHRHGFRQVARPVDVSTESSRH
jgi:hypothetical protein